MEIHTDIVSALVILLFCMGFIFTMADVIFVGWWRNRETDN